MKKPTSLEQAIEYFDLLEHRAGLEELDAFGILVDSLLCRTRMSEGRLAERFNSTSDEVQGWRTGTNPPHRITRTHVATYLTEMLIFGYEPETPKLPLE